jgi:hypothetical protein
MKQAPTWRARWYLKKGEGTYYYCVEGVVHFIHQNYFRYATFRQFGREHIDRSRGDWVNTWGPVYPCDGTCGMKKMHPAPPDWFTKNIDDALLKHKRESSASNDPCDNA